MTNHQDNRGSGETAPLLMDEREAARRLRLSPRTVFGLRKAGAISFCRVNRLVRYTVGDLEDFIAARRHGKTESSDVA